MKTKILTIFALAAILLGLFSGCGIGTPEPTPEPTATPDPHEGMVEVTNGSGGTFWIDEAEDLTSFSLDRYAFSVENGVVSYHGDGCELRRGIDVSDHQGEIDWTAVAASGIDFAMIRIGWRGYGQGTLNEDNRFRENIEGAQAAGLDVGVYFFSQAVSVLEAAEEAVYTAKLLEGYTLELPVFFDWEFIGVEPARTDDTDTATISAACVEFCELLAGEGYTPGVYTYIPAVYSHYDLNALAGLSVWMGDIGTWPEFYYEHDFWQYSITGSVPGIEGDVDLDVMYVRRETNETEMSE